MKWFHHDTDMHRNRKIRKLIRVHGATGYAFWCVLLEKLYEYEQGFQIEADELWFEDIAEDLKLVDYRTPIRILDTLAELKLIDAQLWAEHIIFAPSIAERGDQYIVKRVQETEKKRRYRERKKVLSTVDTEGTRGQKAVLSTSDPDPDPDPDPEKDLERTPLTPQGGNEQARRVEVLVVEEPEPDSLPVTAKAGELALVAKRQSGTEAKVPRRRAGKKAVAAIDIPAWVASHNTNKPERWAGCRGISPEGQRAVQAVIEFYGGDQDLALENHALALQIVRVDSRYKFWREECSGDFLTIIRPKTLDARIGAFAEAARAKGLNAGAVAQSGLSEFDIQVAELAAMVEADKRRRAAQC